MGKIFGTDGVRGIANTELSCELAMKIGRAAATVLTEHNSGRPRIVIGRDTRISGEMLENALVAGICSMGADVEILGVVPTPAIAYLVEKYSADAGVMISASHNPMEFNGIKLFSKDGYKLSDEIENEIEDLIEKNSKPVITGKDIGRIYHNTAAVSDYIQYLKTTVKNDLSGIKAAVDCANGSASATARDLFAELGVNAHIINDIPDGKNINLNCGSTHMEQLIEYVKTHKCDLGIAFDGDADRCLAVDEKGNFIDGDQLMGIFAKNMKKAGKLKDNTVVVTVMSNLGFFHYAEREEIKTATTKVGDRYVLDEMLDKGYNLGGEQSGHIIFSQYAKTGDGQLCAVQLLNLIKEYNMPFSEIVKDVKRYPQVLLNLTVEEKSKEAILNDKNVNELIKKHEKALGTNGRILVRASGTEPLIRVMVEGKIQEEISIIAQEIIEEMKK